MSCAGPGEASDSFQTMHHLPNHLLIVAGVLLETNPILYIGEIFCYPTSHLPLGVTNEGRGTITIISHIKYECGSFKRNSSVAPFSLFISFLYFLFFVFFLVASMALSI